VYKEVNAKFKSTSRQMLQYTQTGNSFWPQDRTKPVLRYYTEYMLTNGPALLMGTHIMYVSNGQGEKVVSITQIKIHDVHGLSSNQ
jgi:hypothetical protein